MIIIFAGRIQVGKEREMKFWSVRRVRSHSYVDICTKLIYTTSSLIVCESFSVLSFVLKKSWRCVSLLFAIPRVDQVHHLQSVRGEDSVERVSSPVTRNLSLLRWVVVSFRNENRLKDPLNRTAATRVETILVYW